MSFKCCYWMLQQETIRRLLFTKLMKPAAAALISHERTFLRQKTLEAGRPFSTTIKKFPLKQCYENIETRKLHTQSIKKLGMSRISILGNSNGVIASIFKGLYFLSSPTPCHITNKSLLSNQNLKNNSICKSQKNISTTSRSHAKKASKSKTKGKKPAIDIQSAEGIVDLKLMQKRMQDVIDEMAQELTSKVPLRITSGYIDHIMVDTGKGKKVPLYQLAQVNSKNDTFIVEVQDPLPNAVKLISAAILETGFNMQPSIKGTTLTIPIPLFTYDQRSNIEKIAKGIANQAKDGLRKVRQKAMIDIRSNKEGQSKDLIRRIENQVQQLTDHFSDKADLACDQKMMDISGSKSK